MIATMTQYGFALWVDGNPKLLRFTRNGEWCSFLEPTNQASLYRSAARALAAWTAFVTSDHHNPLPDNVVPVRVDTEVNKSVLSFGYLNDNHGVTVWDREVGQYVTEAYYTNEGRTDSLDKAFVFPTLAAAVAWTNDRCGQWEHRPVRWQEGQTETKVTALE